MPDTFDDLIIGSGQAGNPLARRLAQAGRRVVLVERKRFGGTCVNVGCIPTKAWVASAKAVHTARVAGELGVSIGGAIAVDMKRVKARKDEIVSRGSNGVAKGLRSAPGITVIEGHARFTAPRTVDVGGRSMAAERIFLNVGARAFVPPIPGMDRVPYLTNTTILELDHIPQHLVILGGSYIGLEFGQMFRRFGSAVTIVERMDRLVVREDPDVSAAVRQIVEGESVKVLTGCEVTGVEPAVSGSGIVLRIKGEGAPAAVEGTHLLVAIGRRPNTDDLGADAAGIKLDKAGYVVVDDGLQSSAPGIWAIGDCNGRGAFTHTSYNDFEIVAANLLDGESRKVSDRIVSYGLYIDPPLGRVGLTEAQVKASGMKALVGKYAMSSVARARLKNETQGFMKIIVEAETGRILGAAMLGVEGDEIAGGLLPAMYAKTHYRYLQHAVPPHPTVTEFLPVLLEDGLKPLV